MENATRPAGGVMIDTMITWVKSLADPLRSASYADRWIAQLPTGDAIAIQKEALELVATFPGARKEVGATQVEALLKIVHEQPASLLTLAPDVPAMVDAVAVRPPPLQPAKIEARSALAVSVTAMPPA